MAPRKNIVKHNIIARPVTGKTEPCAFCHRNIDDELLYGKLYAIGHIQCHYYCVLLSSCLIQKGKDYQGLFGFLFEDILIEIERCTRHKCSYCNQIGASLGCSVTQCRKQFHLPCGKERNSMSLFYGNYKIKKDNKTSTIVSPLNEALPRLSQREQQNLWTFCQKHAPKQNIPQVIMAKANLRKKKDCQMSKECNFKDIKELSLNDNTTDTESQSVCVICYESVDGYPTANTFWPTCCARDAWFHRICLQRMALTAGMHYLKCPLCNDKEIFYEAVMSQGYYVPDRDAAWELEQNAFAEIYERALSCSASECLCPGGRGVDDDQGLWSITICMLCGSSGQHAGCVLEQSRVHVHVCTVCRPAAPEDLDNLASSIEHLISQEQSRLSSRHRVGPVMPSRMSLRRTKLRNPLPIASSLNGVIKTDENLKTNILSSRDELNLKQPKQQTANPLSPIKLTFPITENIRSPLKNMNQNYSPTKVCWEQPNKQAAELLSPIKLIFSTTDNTRSPLKNLNSTRPDYSPTKVLEESLKNKYGSENLSGHDNIFNELRKTFKKPQPLSVKKKIVNNILSGLYENLIQDGKQKEPVKEWNSPKKSSEIDNNVVATTPLKLEVIDITNTKLEILEEKIPEFPSPNEEISKIPPSQDISNISDISKTASHENIEKNPINNETFDFSTTIGVVSTPNEHKRSLFTPKKLKTIDTLTDSRLEISTGEETVNIDVIKVENIQKKLKKNKKCGFKFSPCNKEELKNENIDIDMESFKNQYLNEVGSPKSHEKKKSRKRKLDKEKFIVELESKKKKKKHRRSVSIKNNNIKVKIKWREEKLNLQFNDIKKKKKKKSKKYKQYVLNYSPEANFSGQSLDIQQKTSVLGKPDKDITPIKKKRVKLDKSPDNLVQTCISNFFKVTNPETE